MMEKLPYWCIVQDKDGNLYTAATPVCLECPILGMLVTVEVSDVNGMLSEVDGYLVEFDGVFNEVFLD